MRPKEVVFACALPESKDELTVVCIFLDLEHTTTSVSKKEIFLTNNSFQMTAELFFGTQPAKDIPLRFKNTFIRQSTINEYCFIENLK
jgi:hypothetical protein